MGSPAMSWTYTSNKLVDSGMQPAMVRQTCTTSGPVREDCACASPLTHHVLATSNPRLAARLTICRSSQALLGLAGCAAALVGLSLTALLSGYSGEDVPVRVLEMTLRVTALRGERAGASSSSVISFAALLA
jgi:hypothetical protein